MTQLSDKHRKSIRLPKYDYSTHGWYYVTVCTQNRELFFENNNVRQMIDNLWQKLKTKFHNIDLDEYTIMPNHLHGIVMINRRGDPVWSPNNGGFTIGQPHGVAPTLGEMIGWFKTMTTNYYIQGVKTKNWIPFNKRLWQRNYYEHVIRNEQSLDRIRKYIKNNPDNWENDKNNPKNWKK